MKQPGTILLLALLLTLPGSELASAQPRAVSEALRDCLALTDNLARLTCYDDLARGQAAVAGAGPQVQEPVQTTIGTALPSAPAAPPQAPPTTVAAPRTPVAAFGQSAARVESSIEGTEVLVDRVAEAKRLEPTKWLLTLQSAQVWRQSVGKNYLIRPGDTVRIAATSWGTDFRLSVEGRRGYIQVTRQE